MPPDYHPSLTPKPPLLVRLSPKSCLKKNHGQGVGGSAKMKLAKRKIIPVLVFILCTASIFRFLNISIFANFSVSLPSAALIHHSYSQPPSRGNANADDNSLTEKETRFILDLFSHRVPCNLLVFGSAKQYSVIASMNEGGATLFLEDHNLESVSTSTRNAANNTRVHKIVYNTVASEAYQLLRDARGNPECEPKSWRPRCHLALRDLPGEVYETMWDVVVVDGPRGGTPDSPGRMASIYMAGVLARRGNATGTVIVHDVDRMIEKWFSWEFLCQDNLVSSKGRFWHFRIGGKTNEFCTS